MTTIITIAAIAAIIIIGIFYFRGRRKSHTSRTSSETLAQALVTSVNVTIHDVARSMRTTDNIRQGMLQKIDKAEANLRDTFQQRITSLVKTQEIQKNITASAQQRITALKDQIRNEKREERRLSIARQAVETQHILDLAERRIEEMADGIINAENDFSRLSLVVQQKRAFVLSSTTLDATILEDVNRIERELGERLIDIKSENRANAIINGNDALPQGIKPATAEEISKMIESVTRHE